MSKASLLSADCEGFNLFLFTQDFGTRSLKISEENPSDMQV
jgi:hypothetical protein